LNRIFPNKKGKQLQQKRHSINIPHAQIRSFMIFSGYKIEHNLFMLVDTQKL